MERIVAIKRLGKLLGKEMGYRVDPKAATAEEREEAKQRLPELTAERVRLDKAVNDRRAALLAGDQEYQSLLASYRAARKAAQETGGVTNSYKITVGNSVAGMFFSVMAQGDSWEEVIAIVERNKKR